MNAPHGIAAGARADDSLVAQVGMLRGWLERLHEGSQAAAADNAPSRLPYDIDRIFGLTRFETEILLLCAAMEIDFGFPMLLARVQPDQAPGLPSFAFALAHLSEPDWSAIAPGAPLRYWRLIELAPGPTLATSRLRIDECLLHHLLGVAGPDERLQGLVTPVEANGPLPPSHAALADAVQAALSAAHPVRPIVHLVGPDGAGHEDVAATACARLGLAVERMSAASLPAASGERTELARLWRRHALLADAALLIDMIGSEEAEPRLTAFVAEMLGPVIVASAEQFAAPSAARTLRLDIARPTTMEQAALWQAALGPEAPPLCGAIDDLVGHFDLGRAAIAAAAAAAVPGETPDAQAARLHLACRRQSRAQLDDLAQRIEPRARWDDLVVADATMTALRAICAQVRRRTVVYYRWGFAERFQRGLGVSALFCGPSGTGKTLAAEVLANALELDLYRVDLSRVVSKYIGETERNLSRIFDAAEAGHAVLLFDEADALFGKRTEVKDSHDRYANIEVSYLLQRMEEYRGLAVLTTNMREAIDQAFMRRLRFVVDFPFPAVAERELIWRRMFPQAAPTEGLDFGRLAQLNVPGGNIRNIALAAAFLAADEDRPIGMRHLLTATQTEYAKLDRGLTASEQELWK